MQDVVSLDVAYHVKLASLGVISAAGTICNGISLSFFLRHQRDSLASLHLIALNITDLMISCLSPVACYCLTRFSRQEQEDTTKATLFDIIIIESFLSLSILSCFITTLLSVLRTLVLMKPLYVIRKKHVYLAHCINTIFSLGFITSKIIAHRQNAYDQTEYSQSLNLLIFILCGIQFLYVLMTVGIVGTSSVVAVKALRRSPEILTQQVGGPNNEANRKATIMILTLSIIFVILNCTWCIVWAFCTMHGKPSNTKLVIFAMIFGLFLMAINSGANPVVYMLKNSRLNTYIKSIFRRLKRYLTWESEDAIDNL